MAKRLALFGIALFLGITLGSVNVYAEPPVADAGIDQSAFAGSTVTLNGLNSSDPEAGVLTYLWQQVDNGEQIVDLIDAETALASFVMPVTLTGGSQLLFTLDVTDTEGLQAQDTVAVSNAAQINCDVAEGFQFTGTQGAPIGHLMSLQIGDIVLTPDLPVVDPSNPEATVSVVGVLENINWNNITTDPLSFIARLSAANKSSVDDLLGSLTGNERVLLQFSVYEHDSFSDAYYKSFHSNTVTIAGGIDVVDPEAMSQTADSDMANPENYSFTLSVAADNQTTHHLFRTQSTGLNVTWTWGDDGLNAGDPARSSSAPVRSSLAATSAPVMSASASTSARPSAVDATSQPNRRISAPAESWCRHVARRSDCDPIVADESVVVPSRT